MKLNVMGFFKKHFTQTKYGAYVINLDDKNSHGTHCVSLLIDRNTDTYFDSFGIEYISLEVLTKIKDK